MRTPSTHRDVEERLTAALHARADLVTHDDLTALLVPHPRRSRRRAVLAATGVAAAVVAVAVALPLVGGDRGGEELMPAPAPEPTPSVEQGRAAVVTDMNGDGEDDRVRVQGDRLVLTLSTGTAGAASGAVPGSVLLPPVTDAGTKRPLVVALPPAGSDRPAMTATFRAEGLVFDEAPPSLAVGPGRTVWVDEIGALMLGAYDADVPESQRVSVSATAYHAGRTGELVEHGAGDLCWDRITHAYPVQCEQLPPEDADASLMFPVVEERYPVGTSHGSFDGEYENVVLRRTGDGYEIVYTWDGIVSRAPVAPGGVPELMGSAIGSSLDAPALVVAQESGDGTAMTVFAPTTEGFRALDVEGGRFLGNDAGDGPDHLAQRTWMSQQSGLWTARPVSEDEPDLIEVTRWSVDDTRLVADDQGRACLDLVTNRRLPDATCGAS
jgi:hypothetical protein